MAKEKNVRKKRAHKRSVALVVIVSMLLSILLLLAILRIREENKALQMNEAQLEANVEKESLKEEDLLQEKNSGLTEKKIIEIAREKFGLIFKDEIIFVPKE